VIDAGRIANRGSAEVILVGKSGQAEDRAVSSANVVVVGLKESIVVIVRIKLLAAFKLSYSDFYICSGS
jgi:hypothetical protein